MKVKATVEFYDVHGFMLHSGWYAHVRTFEAVSLKAATDKALRALDVFGALYARAKTITLRCDVEGKLFPVTIDLNNPHFNCYVKHDNDPTWEGKTNA